jgi:aspartate-semialdehyde dehydrogenase
MNRIAVVHPTSLLGKELRERLDQSRDLCREQRLLSADDDEIGTLTEVGGAAAFVGRLDESSFEGVDLAFFCADIARDRPVLAALPVNLPAVVLSRGATAVDGAFAVAGVRPEAQLARHRLVSPHPAAVALALLLEPLTELAPTRATATVVMPVSAAGDAGLDELFEQTRGILAFSGAPKGKLFPTQVAFNLLPADDDAGVALAGARGALGADYPLALHLAQGGIFHSVAVSLHVELGTRPAAAELRRRLARSPAISAVKDGRRLGPVAAAGEERLLLGDVRESGVAGGYWIWAAMDNLLSGGVLNALGLARQLLGSAPPA